MYHQEPMGTNLSDSPSTNGALVDLIETNNS